MWDRAPSVRQLEKKIPYVSVRHYVKPGILQRYHPSRIRVLDARLRQTRVSGVFKIGDVHTILAALAVTLGAKVN